MITREEMIGLLQILADLPSAETKQGRGVRRRVEEAIAALQAGRQSQQAQVEPFAYCHLDVNGKAKELCSAPCADDDPRDTRTVQALYKHPPSPSAVPDEAFNIIEGIRAELTWPGWRSARSRDWVMDSLSELLSMLTASPAPEHSGDGNEMVGWISVDERLPEPGITVMVYAPPQPGDYADDVRIGFDSICPESDGDYWLDHGEHYEHYSMVAKGGEGWGGPSVQAPYTHWMPLPNPPQQEEAEPAVQHRYPCGCVTCICEDDVQCQGCGGTSCDDFKGPSCGCTHLKEEAER